MHTCYKYKASKYTAFACGQINLIGSMHMHFPVRTILVRNQVNIYKINRF